MLTSTLRIYVLFPIVLGLILSCNKPLSPPEKVSYNSDDLNITVNYSRPYKKGRLIFGSSSEGALQPYGEYWRVGANEATQIMLDQDVKFGSQNLSAGEYVLYAVPGQDTWTIGLNSELGRWGAFEVDHTKDVMQVEVQPDNNSSPEVEQFTISFSKGDGEIVYVNLLWDKVKVPIPIQLQ